MSDRAAESREGVVTLSIAAPHRFGSAERADPAPRDRGRRRCALVTERPRGAKS